MKKCVFISVFVSLYLVGCSGYSNQALYPQDIKSVYVEMFDNKTFRRNFEYDLTDAVAKRIEAQTPYKIISDRNKADTIISGQIISLGESTLTYERDTGRSLEKQAEISATFSWKNLKTGEIILENQDISAAASFVEFQQQGFGYGVSVASNKLAQQIVESMQSQW